MQTLVAGESGNHPARVLSICALAFASLAFFDQPLAAADVPEAESLKSAPAPPHAKQPSSRVPQVKTPRRPALVGSTNTFVHGVSNHTDSYVVPVSGLPYNASLKLENVGTFEVVRPRLLVNGHPDWATIDAILQDALKPGMTDREKALALWQFGRANRYHWWPPTEATFEDSDPVKMFSAYGYGFCTNIAQVLCALWERAGLPSRTWIIGPHAEHQVSEAFFDGGWHLLDADRDGLYLRWDNTTIAGVVDLIDDPTLVSRAGPIHADLVSLYANTPSDAWVLGGLDVYSTGHEIGMNLRPHESLTLEWGGGRGYHDDSEAGGSAPPIYGNGQILSSADLTDPGYGRWLFSQNGLRSGTIDGQLPRLGPAGLQAPGEFVFRVDSPYPIIGARLDADVHRASSDDGIDVHAVGWSDGINLVNESLSGASKEYRLPGVFVSESNISTHADDGAWPHIHTKWGLQPASVVYRLTPTQEAGARVIVGGTFYRYLDGDLVGLSISADGVSFQPLWTAGAKQLGYFAHREDVTDAVRGLSSFFVRYDLNALSRGGPYSNWTAGIASFDMRGVSPPQDSLAFTTTGSSSLGDYPVSVDLTGVVARPTAAAAYHYLVRVSMQSSTSVYNVGINSFSLTTTVQVSPHALPALAAGDSVVSYSDGSVDPVALQVTHSWSTYPGAVGKPTAPSGPIAPVDGSDVSISAPIGLAWGSSTTPNGGPGTQDPAGSYIVQYHMQLCDRSDCAWPISPIFDLYSASATPSFPLSFTNWLVPGRRYYWRVQAEDSYAIWGDWGPVWSFVPRVPQVLTVSKAGTGAGGVSSLPAGIQCGAACSASFATQNVVLTAAPDAGSFFAGWSGSGCAGTGTCSISMAADQTVMATFNVVTAPLATTSAAGGITQTTATLNGTVNPNGASTTTAFEYGTTTAYGSTVPALTLTGTTALPITAGVTPLTCGTVYHFRAKGTSAGGTGLGLDATFTTSMCSPPLATTGAASGITQTTAALNGTVNPNGASTTTAFEYGTTTAYGSSAPAPTLTGMAAQPISASVTPLACGTVYHFRAKGTNTGGPGIGLDATFATSTCSSPVATTGASSGISRTTATLNGTVNPNGASTTTAFEYGPTTAYGSTVSALTLTGMAALPISADVTPLTCGTVYHFRAKGTNSGGTGNGLDATFTTSTCSSPLATTGAASGITQTAATLNGTINPNGASTTTAFEYGTTTAYGSTVSALTLTGMAALPISAGVTPLACGTVYHFRAKGTNSGGTGNGLDTTFTTSTCSPPVATTGVASVIGQTMAMMYGTVNPNGASTTTAFEYGTTTAYGSTVSALTLTGTTAQAISAGVTPLACGTLYHFRAKGTNTGGTGIGADATFTTSGCAGASFYTIQPCRLLDTRSTGTGDPALAAMGTRTIILNGRCGIPPGAKALTANITVVAPAAPGNLVLYPADAPGIPVATSISFQGGRTRANNALVSLAANDGGFKVTSTSAAQVDLVLDVSGYFK